MGNAFVIGHITVKDAEKWDEYRNYVPATLKPWGVELVFRGKLVSILTGETCAHRHGRHPLSRYERGQRLVRVTRLSNAHPPANKSCRNSIALLWLISINAVVFPWGTDRIFE